MQHESTVWGGRVVASIACIASLALGTAHGDVLVNNPALDAGTTQGFTQLGSTVLSFGSTVLVAYNDSGSFVGSNPNRFTGLSRSTDGGLTFADLGSVVSGASGTAGFPHLARDATTGTVYLSTLAYSNGTLQIFRSGDGGLTFSAPAAIGGASSVSDRSSIVVDNNPGPGRGNVYVAVRDLGPANSILFYRSTDGGLTFGPGIQVASGVASNVNGPSITVGTDHSVNVTWLAQAGNSTLISTRRSTDSGLTFAASTTAATLSSTPPVGDAGLTGVRSGTSAAASFRSDAFPRATANPVTGELYVTFMDKALGSDKADVYLVTSKDRGATWSPRMRINSDATANDQWQPSIAVTPDGQHLGIFWYDRRLDPTNNLIDYFGRVCDSVAAALVCGADFRISDQSFLPEFGRDNVVNTAFMGDYDEASADNSFFYVAWGDSRLSLGATGRNDPNIFFDRVAVTPVVAIPEPGTVALLLVGGGALLARLKRARRSADTAT